MSWVCVRDIHEETVDRDQAAISSRDAVLSLGLEVVQERENGGRAELVQPQSNHLAACPPRREAEEELDAVSVGKDGVRADVALS